MTNCARIVAVRALRSFPPASNVGGLVLADQRWRCSVDTCCTLAIVALPILRPLRLLRRVILLGIFQRIAGRTPARQGRDVRSGIDRWTGLSGLRDGVAGQFDGARRKNERPHAGDSPGG